MPTKTKPKKIGQLAAVRSVLLAAKDWVTVNEIAIRARRKGQENGISARISELRKPANGGYVIEKRFSRHMVEYRITGQITEQNAVNPSQRKKPGELDQFPDMDDFGDSEALRALASALDTSVQVRLG